MLNKALHRWHLRRSNFSKALAHRGKKQRRPHPADLWSYYRLGMYETAAAMPLNGSDWRGFFAKAVSLAACGRHDETEALLEEMESSCPGCPAHYAELADALAPFMPRQALSLLEKTLPPLSLHAALLLKTGKTAEARTMLEEAISRREGRKNPELLLYRRNAMTEASPAQQLTDLNRFLVGCGVPKVALRDRTLPPVPTNVRCSGTKVCDEGPLVTVLMTTFRTGHRADAAIASVLGQSYRNIELIVVDDASGDDTPEMIRAWAQRDSRVKCIELPCNVGTYVAKNIGLQHAKGEFVTCHDSDDWSHPLKIERQVKPLLKNRRLVATTSQWVRMDDDGSYYARPVHAMMRLNPSSPLFRRKKVLKHAGIWDCVRTGADSEFLARLRLVFGKKAVRRIKQPLSLGAHRADSLMTANDTGYCESSISPQRLAYWESWNSWHMRELEAGRKPYIAEDLLAKRTFDAPEAIRVPQKKIMTCLDMKI